MSEEIKKYAKRPPRLDRVFAAYPLYFVTFNTWNKMPVLANDPVHNEFIRFTNNGVALGCATGRYVIMPDHIHLFVRIGPDRRLDQFIRMLKQALTKVIRDHYEEICGDGSFCGNASVKRFDQNQESGCVLPLTENASQKRYHNNSEGTLHRSVATMQKALTSNNVKIWQTSFFDHLMRSSESYSEKWEYVRQNPVRGGLVRCADDWRFQGELTELRY